MSKYDPLIKRLESVAEIGITAQLRDLARQSIDAISELYTVQDLATGSAPAFNFAEHLRRQHDFSAKTFGPGMRTEGTVDHIRKELNEILDNPNDLTEWIDVVILALDGAWRMGASPEQIIDALVAKQAKNEGRQWPDWRTAAPGKAIEHIKPGATPASAAVPVWLVATGEITNGMEQYTRHDTRPELCDAEKLYTQPPASKPDDVRALAAAHASSYPSQHHIVFTLDGLTRLVESFRDQQ